MNAKTQQPPRLAGFFLALFLLQAITVAVASPSMLNVGGAQGGDLHLALNRPPVRWTGPRPRAHSAARIIHSGTAGMKYDPTLPWRDVTGGGFNDHIGPVKFAQVGEGEYHFALPLEERHMNSGGVAHGGLMMSVADTGLGCSAFTAAGSKPVATIDFECDFLAPGKQGQMLHGEARVVRKAREFLFMAGDLYADSRHVLRVSGIWVIRSGGGLPREDGGS